MVCVKFSWIENNNSKTWYVWNHSETCALVSEYSVFILQFVIEATEYFLERTNQNFYQSVGDDRLFIELYIIQILYKDRYILIFMVRNLT